jgi:iron(III) transport system substrate-binding protein
VEAFQEAYPNIEVEMVRGATELTGRVDQEIASGTPGADVFLYAGQQWFLDNADHLAELDVPAAENWPAEGWAVDGKAPVVSLVPAGFITWNTEIFPDGFTDWEQLTDPSVKGKLGMRDTIEIVTASHLQFLEDTNGEDFLPALAGRDPKFYSSVVPMTQAVASGEIGVSPISTTAIVKELQASGAPIDYTIPEEAWASVYPAAALENAENPAAARVFMNFLMSEEGQTAFNGDSFGGSYLEDVPGTVDTSGLTVLDAASFGPDKVAAWVEKFRGIYNR